MIVVGMAVGKCLSLLAVASLDCCCRCWYWIVVWLIVVVGKFGMIVVVVVGMQYSCRDDCVGMFVGLIVVVGSCVVGLIVVVGIIVVVGKWQMSSCRDDSCCWNVCRCANQ